MVCWNCEKPGHIRRNCKNRQSYRNTAVNPNVIVKGLVENVETDMLIDTGSAVTIIQTYLGSHTACSKTKLKPATFPVVTANGKQLDICGEAALQIRIGESTSQQNVLIAKDVTQKCVLGTDFLPKENCIINLDENLVTVGLQKHPIQYKHTKSSSVCQVMVAETTEIPACHQVCLTTNLEAQSTVDHIDLGMF